VKVKKGDEIMTLDEKTFDRMLGRLETQVRTVMDQRGIKPKSVKKKRARSKQAVAQDCVSSIKSEAIRMFLACCR
jgi:multidrug resistance efflux pump